MKFDFVTWPGRWRFAKRSTSGCGRSRTRAGCGRADDGPSRGFVREHVGSGVQNGRDVIRAALEVPTATPRCRWPGTASLIARTAAAPRGAPPSGRSSPRDAGEDDVARPSPGPFRRAGEARPRRPDRASRVMTSQNPQRGCTSLRGSRRCLALPQHSAMLGHIASSQTVCNEASRISPFRLGVVGPSRAGP